MNFEVLKLLHLCMNVMKFALNDNQKVLIDSQGLNFRISFYFFQKLDLGVFVDLEKFQP